MSTVADAFRQRLLLLLRRNIEDTVVIFRRVFRDAIRFAYEENNREITLKKKKTIISPGVTPGIYFLDELI